MFEAMLYWIKRFLPKQLVHLVRPPYHILLAWIGAHYYRHPSKDMTVIAVTGTKGKSTVTEIIAQILESAGHTTAALSTIQFTIGDTAKPNLYKMTTPGRFFVQHFLRKAVNAGCTHAVLELTSEGSKQSRHRFIELDALVFTNLTPEHIESHGSFENYKRAKLDIAQQVERSEKRPRFLVANTDDEHGADFLDFKVEQKLSYGLADLKLYTLQKDSVALVFEEAGEEVTIRVPVVGLFNVYNLLAAITVTRALGVPLKSIAESLRNLRPIRGRVEHFTTPKNASKQLTAIVDYAHTPDSLKKLYQAFQGETIIGVLGNTGGGRDTWKRPEMARIAEEYCTHIILTNEDPYDENPNKIIEDMMAGITDTKRVEVVMDRREAIRKALELAPAGAYVIISGKGTDPYIMGPNNTKEPWSDAKIVQELLQSK